MRAAQVLHSISATRYSLKQNADGCTLKPCQRQKRCATGKLICFQLFRDRIDEIVEILDEARDAFDEAEAADEDI